MANTSAVDVLLAYRNNPNPEVRANLAAVLGALGNARCVDALVELSLDDEKEDVRDRAVTELQRLFEGEGGLDIARGLAERLKGRDQTTKARVLELIGRVRLSGSSFPAVSGTWRESIDYLSSMYRIRFRRALSAMAWSVPTLIAVCGYVAFKTDWQAGEDFYYLLAALSLTAVFFLALFFFRSAPLWQAFEPRRVLAVDLILGGIGVFVTVSAFVGFLLTFDSSFSPLWFIICGGTVGSLALAATHLGVALTDSSGGTQLLRVVKQYSVGVALGATALFLLTAAWRMLAEADATRIEAVRVAGVIILSGLAALASRSERGRSAFRDVAWARYTPRIAYALLAVLVAVAIYPSLPARGAVPVDRALSAEPGEPLRESRPMETSETFLPIEAKFAQSVSIAFARRQRSVSPGSIRLFNVSAPNQATCSLDGVQGSREEIAFSSSGEMRGVLGVGCYVAELRREVQAYGGFDAVLDFLVRGDEVNTWQVTLNREMSRAVEGALPSGARSGSVAIKPKSDSLETSLSIELDTPRRVGVSVVRQGEFVDEAAPDRRSTSVSIQPRIEGRDRQGRDVRNSGENGVVDDTLQPGAYRIVASGTQEGEPPESLLIVVEAVGGDTLALLRPESIESETAWVIDAVPSDRTFRVDEAVAVRIELVRPSADLVVSLRADGKEVARADDPEIIESRLAPGTYTIRAAAYSGDSRTLGPAVRLAVRVSGP